jgi:hypothetical protein
MFVGAINRDASLSSRHPAVNFAGTATKPQRFAVAWNKESPVPIVKDGAFNFGGKF